MNDTTKPTRFTQASSTDGFVIENFICDWYTRFANEDAIGDCIDGGAFQGFHAYRMAKHFSGRIFAIEASPLNYKELVDRMVGWPRRLATSVVPLNLALVGDSRVSRMPFYQGKSHPGRSTLKPEVWKSLTPEDSEYSDPIEVECRTIDRLVEENDIDKLAVLKLDLEGAELDALIGARQSLKHHRTPIVMEFGLRKNNEKIFEQRFGDFFALLAELEYSALLPWGEEIDVDHPIPYWYVFLIPVERPIFRDHLERVWESVDV